jgi:hypothetical protein
MFTLPWGSRSWLNPCGRALLAAALFPIFYGLSGCASVPALPCDQDDVIIRYQDVGNAGRVPLVMLLINGSHPDYDETFKTNRNRAKIQRIPPDRFRDLLNSLNEKGFFTMAESGPSGQLVKKQIISVETPLRKWSLSPNPAFTLEERRKFTAMSQEIWEYFNSGNTLQVIDNPDGADFFQKQNVRIQQGEEKRQRQ